MTAGNAPNSSSTVSVVSNSPSRAKNASGSATRRTTEQDTSPSFHCSPASSPTIEAYPRKITMKPLIALGRAGVHLVRHGADEPTCPGWNPSVTSSLPAISRIVVASDDGAAASCTSAETTS